MNTANRHFIFPFLLGLIAASLACGGSLAAQDSGPDRHFTNPTSDVEKAVQQVQPSLRGRLPILDGFVGKVSEPLDRFDRGYYDCATEVSAEANGQTVVSVHAKITAWYSDPSGAQSGYRVLPSNGRIETDVLDQVSAALGSKPAIDRSSSPVATAPHPSALRPTLPSRPSIPATTSASSTAVLPTEDVESLRQRREEAEKQAKSLETQVEGLEEILRNQSHPDNLAVVRKTGTPVLSQPGGTVLMTADANDEFEIISVNRDWIHVQISGASRGWIQRAQVEMPEGFSQAPKNESTDKQTNDRTFRVSHEETHPFSGDWPQLQGKTVRIIWVEPLDSSAAESPSASEKRKFVMSVLAGAYKERSSGEAADGVVIVFDSVDGGQISATMSSLAQWTSGALSEEAFWKQCSVDPPDFFQNALPPKPTPHLPSGQPRS